MRIKGEYVLREIGGDFVLVPIGDAAMEINGLITLDEVAVQIWNNLTEGKETDQILAGILDTYDVSEQIAKADLEEFLDKLTEEGLLEK